MKWLIPLLAIVMLAAPVSAQQCQPTDRIVDCWDKFNPLPDQADEATEETVATAATGVTNVASPAESPLKDFLSLLSATMESATSTQDGQAYTFDWNPQIAFTEAWGVKFQASFAEAQLNDAVTKSLADNATEVQTLTDSLEFGDDTTISGFVQPRQEQWGRSIAPHRNAFGAMVNAIRSETSVADQEALGTILDAYNIDAETRTFNTVTDENGALLSDAARTTLIGAVEGAAKGFQARTAKLATFAAAYAKLLNNQPQLYGGVVYHARRNVVGPNEWSGKFTYEMAGNNLNQFRKDTPACDTEEKMIAAATECAAAVQAFAAKTRPGIERISLSLEYHKVNRRWINDPEAGLDLGYPRSRSFLGTLAFGTTMTPVLPLRTEENGVGDARLDFTAKYELPEDNDSEQKGFVGTLTYTQKINATFSLPLSFVYSDHESDLVNVQKRFSARFGLMYKLPDFN